MTRPATDPTLRLDLYLQALSQLRAGADPLVSVILFGSTAQGTFVSETSDVDLFIVFPDSARPEDRVRIRQEVADLEIAHGFRLPASRPKNPLAKFAARAAGHAMSCFILSRADLLSGDVARIFDLRPVEAVCVDRILLASIVVSASTVWGEDLLPQVPLLPLRRLDVFKALFSFMNAIVMSAVGFLLLPDATKYAMGVLKHSLHSCYFCYHLKTAPLPKEIEFLQSRLGPCRILQDLLAQRENYHRSFSFVLRCAPTLLRLHLRTARENRFPRAVRSY